MLGVVLVELGLLAGMWAAFIVTHLRARVRGGWVWWQLLMMAVVGLGEALSLFLLGTGHPVPLWVFALGFGATDVVMAGWLLLLWRARREERGRVE